MPEQLITYEYTPPLGLAAGPRQGPIARPVPLHELAERYSPAHGYATITVPVNRIALGDVVDHTRGLLVVTEITRRHSTWTIGGYDPATPYLVPDPAPTWWGQGNGVDRPLLTRNLSVRHRVRVRRPAAAWLQLPGHTKLIKTYNTVTPGTVNEIDGWTTGCSCGWTGPVAYTNRGWAEDAVGKHRAEVITAATREQLSSLATIEQLETELGELLPWQWDEGASAALHGLTTADALNRLTPWANALGVGIEHISADDELSTGAHWLWVDSPPTWDTPALDIRAYPTALES